MKILTITLSILSILVCQVDAQINETDRDFEQIQESISGPIEVYEYDKDGRTISTRQVERTNTTSEPIVDREFEIIQEGINESIEIIEYDMDGRTIR